MIFTTFNLLASENSFHSSRLCFISKLQQIRAERAARLASGESADSPVFKAVEQGLAVSSVRAQVITLDPDSVAKKGYSVRKSTKRNLLRALGVPVREEVQEQEVPH